MRTEPLVGSGADDAFTVVIPVLDEERTIADVIAQGFRGGAAAVLVVDSGSTDASAERSVAAGARCVHAADLAPHGPARGKGDALWRALALVETPIAAFIDGDLVIDGATFLPALLAPLRQEGIVFSKADFDRVRRDGTGSSPGRVTEFVAKPLLRHLFPELGALHEPLSGQIAARTDVLRCLPFDEDYGLEAGMLIDARRRFGDEAIAHPHCGVLSHDPQTDTSLQVMADQVSRAILTRAGAIPPSARTRPPHQQEPAGKVAAGQRPTR